MTPTGRNRLFELLMSGAKSTLRGDEPEQTGEILPLARFPSGGVFPAIPGIAQRALNSLQGSGRNTYPETFSPEGPRDVLDAAAYQDAGRGFEGAIPLMGGGAIGTAAGATKGGLGIFGGVPKHLRAANDAGPDHYNGVARVMTGEVDSSVTASPMPWGRETAANTNSDLRGVLQFRSGDRAMDFFGGLRKSPSGSIPSNKLYADYVDWSKSQGLEPVGEGVFARMANDRGLQRAKIGGIIRYIGVE